MLTKYGIQLQFYCSLCLIVKCYMIRYFGVCNELQKIRTYLVSLCYLIFVSKAGVILLSEHSSVHLLGPTT